MGLIPLESKREEITMPSCVGHPDNLDPDYAPWANEEPKAADQPPAQELPPATYLKAVTPESDKILVVLVDGTRHLVYDYLPGQKVEAIREIRRYVKPKEPTVIMEFKLIAVHEKQSQNSLSIGLIFAESGKGSFEHIFQNGRKFVIDRVDIKRKQCVLFNEEKVGSLWAPASDFGDTVNAELLDAFLRAGRNE